MSTKFQQNDPDPYYEFVLTRLDRQDAQAVQHAGFIRRRSEWKALGLKKQKGGDWELFAPAALNDDRRKAIDSGKRYFSGTKNFIWLLELGIEPSEIFQLPAGFRELSFAHEAERAGRLEEALELFKEADIFLRGDRVLAERLEALKKRLMRKKAA
jgi:hypothetical protein